MGRKRKYNTVEEKKAARARHDADYYKRNKHSISKKAAARYNAKAIDGLDVPDKRTISRKSASSREKPSLAKSGSSIIEKQLQLLNELVGESMRTFGEALYTQALEAYYDAPEQLDAKLTQIREIELLASNTCDGIWEAEGATSEWRRLKDMMYPFQQVAGIVTELWDLTVSDPFHTQDMELAKEAGKLIYQSL